MRGLGDIMDMAKLFKAEIRRTCDTDSLSAVANVNQQFDLKRSRNVIKMLQSNKS